MVFRDYLFFKDPSLTFEILLVIFLAVFLLIFSEFIKDIYIIFSGSLSRVELYNKYKKQIKDLIAREKVSEAFELASK